MNSIEFDVKVENNKVLVSDIVFTTGTVNNYVANLQLPEEYDGLTVYMLFNTIRCPVESNKCIMPEIVKPGNLKIGVVAFNGEGENLIERYSPEPAVCYVVIGSYSSCQKSPDNVSVNEYEQLISLTSDAVTAAEAAQATADEIKEQAESGAFDGEQGPQGEKGEKGDTGPQGPPGEDGASPFTVISPGKTEAEAYEILLPGMYVVSNVGYISIGSVNSVSADIQTKTPLKVGYPAVIFYGFTGLTASDDIGYIILLGSDVQLYTQNVRGELKEKNFKLSSNLAEFDGVEIDFPTFVSVMETLLTSLAEMIVAKKNAPTISNVTISNITLNNNNEYRMQSTASLNLALPLTIPDDYECSLVFESGATATVLSYPADSIKFIGDDCDAEGDFIPEANTGYEISVKNLGFDRVVARVGAF